MMQIEYRECMTVPGKFGNVTIGRTMETMPYESAQNRLDELKEWVRHELKQAVTEAQHGSYEPDSMNSLREENERLAGEVQQLRGRLEQFRALLVDTEEPPF